MAEGRAIESVAPKKGTELKFNILVVYSKSSRGDDFTFETADEQTARTIFSAFTHHPTYGQYTMYLFSLNDAGHANEVIADHNKELVS